MLEALVLFAIEDIHRIAAPAHGHHRRAVEMRPERLDVDRRRCDDEFEIRPPPQQRFHVADQEVHVQAALVGLVDDQHFVAVQVAVGSDFGQEQPIGHHLDEGVVANPLGEAHRVPDHAAERRLEFDGDAFGNRPRGQPARLRMADHPAPAQAGAQARLGQLGGLAGAGLARDDDDLARTQQGDDLVDVLRDGQFRRKVDSGDRRVTPDVRGLRGLEARALAVREPPLRVQDPPQGVRIPDQDFIEIE